MATYRLGVPFLAALALGNCGHGIDLEGGADASGEDIAEVPATAWSRTFGTIHDDRAYSVSQMPDGGYVVAGSICSEEAGGELDEMGWILRLDYQGTFLWDTSFSRERGVLVHEAVPSSDGGIIGAGGLMRLTEGGRGTWVFKLDASGSLTWSVLLEEGGSGDMETPISLEPCEDGGAVVVSSAWYDEAGTPTLGLLAARLDPYGAVLWQKTYGPIDSMDKFKASISKTSDGGYIMAGSGDVTGSPIEQHWAIKIDADGEVIWQRGYMGVWETHSVPRPSVLQAPDGRYMLASQHALAIAGFSGLLLAVLGPTGELEWSTVYDADSWSESYATSLSAVRGGGFIMAGAHDGHDMWVLRFNESGDLVWQRTYGPGDGDTAGASSVVQVSDRGFIVAGMTRERLATESDIWILKLDTDGLISRSCPSWIGKVGDFRVQDASLTEIETSLTMRPAELEVTMPELEIVHQEASVETQCER